MLRRFIYLITLICMLLSLVSPAQANPPTPTPQTNAPAALEATLGKGLDPQAFPPAAPLVIVFSEAMDTASAQPALLTFPYLAGQESWDKDAKTLTFQPQGGFPGGKEVQVFLNDALRATTGAAFPTTQRWTLDVLGAPRVVFRDPIDPLLTLRQPTITVEFDRPMDPDSLKAAIKLEPAVSYTVKANGKKVDIAITQPLDPGTQLKLSLTSAAKDTAGAPLDRPYAWSYRVLPFELSEVECSQWRINLKLSYSVPIENFQQAISVDPPIQGPWFADGANLSFHIQPEQALDWAQRYTISFKTPLKDTAGLPLPAIAPVTCTIDPPLTVAPENNERGSDSFEKVQVTFSTAMEPESVKQAFSIQPNVPGKLTYTADGKASGVLTFVPERHFDNGASYTVTLAPSMRTADGHPILADPYQQTFRMTDYWYGYNNQSVFADHGSNIQVVDADAPRYLQLSNRANYGKLYFDAYPVDLPKFVQLYRQSFGSVNAYYGQTRSISTEGLTALQSFSLAAKEGVNDLLLPKDLPNGLYVLNMRSEGGLLDQIFIVLTRSTITAKLSNSRLFAWTTNINGEVVPEAEMRLYTKTGELMREGKADKDGVYEVAAPLDDKPMLIAARDADGDITVAGLSGEWGSTGSNSDYWYGYYTQRQPTPRVKAYIFTDRPIYRPGNTVHYKAILRNDNDMRYTLLESSETVNVRLLDARGNLLEEREQHTNDFGTLNGDFPLPTEGNLGSYKIEVQALDQTIQQPFSVEEYHKPDYSVTLQADKKAIVDNEEVNLTIEARYFLGQPVANAEVTLTFFSYYGPATTITGMTDSNGRYTFLAIGDLKRVNPWYYYEVSNNWGSNLTSGMQMVEASVSDGSNQPVSAATSFRVYNATEGLDLDTHGYFKTPGQPFSVDVKASTYDGKPVANRKVSLVVYGSNDYSWDKEVSKAEAVTGADGKATVEVTLEAGDYKIAAIGADNRRTDLYDNAWVTAYKPGRAWNFGSRDEFLIKAEKAAYQPYEKAKLLIRSTFSGPALLTFERGSVIHSDRVILTAPLTEIETEVIPEYAPNVYVTINAWQEVPFEPTAVKKDRSDFDYYLSPNRPNSKLRLASVEMKVESTEKQLDVTVASAKTTFAPREQAEFTIQVSKAGAPVQAELAIGLVDEAIYSLKAEPWKAIYPAFYDPRPHSVATYDSLAIRRYMIEEGGRGGGGGEPTPNLSSPRAEFPDTAVWLPAVVTDAQGKATVRLTLPDSLTRWRLTVRAVTPGTQVDQTTYTVQTQQAIALRPAFPSLVTAGDQFALTAYAHNLSETVQTLTATLSAPGLAVIGGGTQTVTVKPGEALPLQWQVRADTAGTSDLTVNVSGTNASIALGDAIRLPITVQPRATLNLDQRSGQFSGQLDAPVFLPSSATNASSVHLELSRSIAGDALSGLEALIGYPYGCVEQTMSKALPNAVVGRTLKRLNLSNPDLERQLPGLIDAGVKKLYGMQHYDGGWGWWTNDDTDAYQTAWVVFGLSLTREAGYPVDAKVIHRGARALKGLLGLSVPREDNEKSWNEYSVESASKLDPKLQAFMLYSLAYAGEGDEKLTLALYETYPTLDTFSQSALALALHKLGRSQEAGQIVSELESTAYRSNGEAYWTGWTEDGEYHHKTMSSEIRTAALALEAIQTIRPNSPLTGEIVRYLMGHKQVSGWGTTNETAFTLIALTGQLEAAKDVTSPASYKVLVNGKEVSQADWKAEDLRAVIDLPRSALATGLNRLEIVPDGDTPLYYALAVRLYEDAAKARPAGSMIIKREYVDAASMKELTTFEDGQLVKVLLTVTAPSDHTAYVMIEDHLPAGLEALNEGLDTTSHSFNEEALYYYDNPYYSEEFSFNPFSWQTWGYNNKEIRDGRVSFFITSLNDKTITLTYYARALRSGTFTALPAEVSAMYDLTQWGRSDSAVVAVKQK